MRRRDLPIILKRGDLPMLEGTFQQERAPGIAEDRSTVVASGREVGTPLRTFSDCIKTKDFAHWISQSVKTTEEITGRSSPEM